MVVTPPKSPGRRLVETLTKGLDDGVEWTEAEQVTLGLIETAGDRLAVLKRLFDAEMAKLDVSTRRVTELSAEIRQTEANIGRWTAVLDPYMSREPKSQRHQAAAFTRWHGGAA